MANSTTTLQDKERQKRLELRRYTRSQHSKNKASARRVRGATANHQHVQQSLSSFHDPWPTHAERKGYEQITLPEVLDLDDHYEETVKVTRLIRLLALRDHKPVYLVFDNVKLIKPAALLLLLAELHRCRLIHGNQKITGNYPTSPKIERMLHATGFFKLLGIHSRVVKKPKSYPMEYVEYVSHTNEVKGTVRGFREAILGTAITMSPMAKGRFYRALTEAMLNVSHHAYPKNSAHKNPQRGRWWLAGHVNRKTKELIIMFCDLGVGIPATLPKIYTLELIRSVLALLPGIPPNDAQMIQAGMAIGRTRTREQNRGRGLNDLRSLVDQAGEGELNIYSHRGHYRYKPNDNDTVRNYNGSIGGTLITWTVPLDSITNWIEQAIEDEYV
ncbi:MAG: hypothetical protein K8H75_13310 [Sulfuricella sp.]|nr:hypothetical protein [Sulfuricella sp.]